ncbi:hypothetical protein RB5054 [Rhodopirellula baltica SH 1]|uniref:Uncharacterized protein n=1 Tax=Rhodopirellula baltica (strain DSM 10527 / NCIMB 13988 / SH1) TaxID=243090 RepID=Q7UGS1_RHOBA|nr:hypothetical protein RB5054 [Rhodopirellula baltica SH 1]
MRVHCKVQFVQCKLQSISGLASHLFNRPAIANLQCPFCNLQSPRPTLRSRHIAPEEAVVGDAALLRRVRDRLKVNSVQRNLEVDRCPTEQLGTTVLLWCCTWAQ